MSLKKRATRRLSLLAGSSLVGASLSVAVSAVAVLAPSGAAAQATCVAATSPVIAGNGTNTVTLPAGTYDPGVTCTYSSDTAVVTTSGAITVSTTGGVPADPLVNGVNLVGGANDVTWNSGAGTVTGGAQTHGPVIDATTSGDISITTAGITGNQAGRTHGIRATSTGGGNITIARTTGTVNNTVAGGQAAIEAVTNGGNISIGTGTASFGSTSTNGRLRGIFAQTSGSGSIAMNVGSVSANSTDGIAAIEARAGTGGLNMTITGGVNGGAGPTPAIIVSSTGGAVVNVTTGTIGNINFNMPNGGGRLDFSGVTGGGVALTFSGASSSSGRWLGTGNNVFSGGNDVLTLGGVGENFLGGRSGTEVAFIDFGAGNDTMNVAALFNMGAFTQNAGTINFGSGQDTLNLSGVLSSHGGTLSNLETFNLSGTIFMGPLTFGSGNLTQIVWNETDRTPDDVLRANGAAFTGSGSARIVMDVLLGNVQAGCETVSTADCLDLRGGSTAGVTVLSLNNLTPEATQAGFDPVGITLVDVGGGTSAQGHFVLDPNTAGLTTDPNLGEVIQRPGLFSYALRYNPENQRHVLISLPRGEVFDYAVLGSMAQSIWHMTSALITDRHTDLRAGTEGEVWLRTSGEYTQREMGTSFETFSDQFTVDNGYKLYAGTIMGGMDLVTGHSGGYDYVAGVQIGYVASTFDLNASETSGRFSGATGGVYGSIWTDRMFLDGTFNMNGLTLDYDSPGLGSKTNTYTTAFGARLDGGLRWPLMENLVAEPLATLAFARTGFEEISLSGGEIRPADAQSRRGALGLRLAGTLGGGESLGATYFVTGRAWHELDGEADGVVNNPGQDLVFHDEFSGGFGEAEAGINLFNPARTLSGYLASGVKFKDGYSAVDLSLGLRMAW